MRYPFGRGEVDWDAIDLCTRAWLEVLRKTGQFRVAENFDERDGELKRQFEIERPLIDQTFQTDGVDLFVEHYGDLVNASRGGQQAMKDIISV